MTGKTAAMAAAATQPLPNADLLLADFEPQQNVSGRSKHAWTRVHDRAVGALIGIAFTGAMWAAWAMVATNT